MVCSVHETRITQKVKKYIYWDNYFIRYWPSNQMLAWLTNDIVPAAIPTTNHVRGQLFIMFFKAFSLQDFDFYVFIFTTYIWSIVESTTQVWNPHHIQNIDIIENEHRRFTKPRAAGMQRSGASPGWRIGEPPRRLPSGRGPTYPRLPCVVGR